MVEFKTKNGMASLESQIIVTPQMAKLLKSNPKRVKAFIKDAKLKCEYLVVENTSILGTPIAEGNATETIAKLEKTHKELLSLFEEEERKAIAEEGGKKAAAEEQRRKAADEEGFNIERMKEVVNDVAKKAIIKNVGILTIVHNGTTGEVNIFGTMPPSIATMLLLATHEED